MSSLPYHISVLPKESILALNIKPGDKVVEGTYGAGGHAKLILDHIGNGVLVAFDQDEDALVNKIDDQRLWFVRHNFRYLKNFLRYFGIKEVDAVFGVAFIISERAVLKFSSMAGSALSSRSNDVKRCSVAIG